MDFMKKVSEFSQKVAETTTKAYNDVAGKTNVLIEESKTKALIKDKEAEIVAIYEAIGGNIYEKHTKNEKMNADYALECEKIDRLNFEIKELNKKLLYGKNLRNCVKCGEVIPLSSTFCEKCGEKQEAVEIMEEPKEQLNEESTEEKVEVKAETEEKKVEKEKAVCPQCGNVQKANSKFCGKCGYKL